MGIKIGRFTIYLLIKNEKASNTFGTMLHLNSQFSKQGVKRPADKECNLMIAWQARSKN